MAVTLQYTIELDHRIWIPVPLAFPWNGYASAEVWSVDLAASLMTGMAAPITVERELAASALAMAESKGPLPGALERFWYFPLQGGPDRLAHLYVSEYPADDDGDLTELARAGIGGFVQATTTIEQTPFDRAARAVLIGELPDGRAVFVERLLGFAGGLVFILELVDDDALVFSSLEQPMEQLFRSIRLRG